MKMSVKGNSYIVKDRAGLFSVGDIVIAIENDDIPFCVSIDRYKEDFNVDDYRSFDVDVYAYVVEYDLIPYPYLNGKEKYLK